MFTTAINWGIITLNPCDHVTLPNPVTAIPTVPDLRGENYFTAEQTIIFLEYLNKNFQSTHSAHDRTMTNGKEYHVAEYTETHSIPSQLRIFYNLAVYGGLRRSELVGLQWSNVDFKKNTLTINQATVQVHGKAITKNPKSVISRRVISLPVEIMAMLREYRTEQLEYRLALGTYWKGEDYVFIQRDGRQIYPDTPTKALKKSSGGITQSIRKNLYRKLRCMDSGTQAQPYPFMAVQISRLSVNAWDTLRPAQR